MSSGKREFTQKERLNAGCGCAALFVLSLFALLGSLGNAMCETTIYAQSTSPSGFINARVQMTDCGATTGYSRIVWVQPSWIPRDDWLSCRALILENQWPVDLEWSADGALLISTPADRESVTSVAKQCYGTPIQLRRTR